MLRISILVASTISLSASNANAKTINASKLSENALNAFMSGESDDVLEFQKGDEIKVTFKAEGDLLETTSGGPAMVKVKKTFYIKIDADQLLMSFDGQDYRPLKDTITGSLKGSASGDPAPVTDLGIMLSVYVRE